ncbi:NADPH-dependent FMN reductase [Kribbella kalugense]|uniref:NAD(P)H-dependent FMN reductase n=1 Tax=Kribbella kalugense TaxID=2512221 RepID=A0A4R8A155_9ACTN|nr:NAD(P)H-dependent oxidoreductase [Kribbella kalugense]TDW24237.1 NAD(P)H-dependent FMN reductase [Kribbella kalugense]
MVRIAIVVGSTRPGRRGDQVARWVHEQADIRSTPGSEATYTIVDLADLDLPLLNEPEPAAIGAYRHEHTRRWAKAVASFDGFIFVTPEYNHAMPAVLKNAIDYLFTEWNDKAAGFVSYGFTGGVRAVEQLRLTLSEVKVASVRSQVALNLHNDFAIIDWVEPGAFTPADHHLSVLDRMLGELVEWSEALARLRHPESLPEAAAR